MYISEKLIFVHIPKTGGMSMLHNLKSMNNVLRYQAKRFHGSVQDNRPELMEGDKPIIAFVRNPFSWYVSWYHSLQKFPEGSSVLFDLINTNNFIEDIHTLFDTCDGGILTQKHKQQLVNKRRHPAEYSNGKTFEQTKQWHECGLLSWNYHWLIFGDEDINRHDYTNITIGKQENSTQDRIDFFNKIGVLTPDIEQRIRKAVKVNITKPTEDYRTYYDDKLIERVMQKEKYIIDKYNYTFDI